jgi:hypothetical protein
MSSPTQTTPEFVIKLEPQTSGMLSTNQELRNLRFQIGTSSFGHGDNRSWGRRNVESGRQYSGRYGSIESVRSQRRPLARANRCIQRGRRICRQPVSGWQVLR